MAVFEADAINLITAVLRDYVDIVSADLQIEQREEITKVRISSEYALDITTSCQAVRMVMAMASHISISTENCKIVIDLLYNAD